MFWTAYIRKHARAVDDITSLKGDQKGHREEGSRGAWAQCKRALPYVKVARKLNMSG